jgi:Protein of unknown function (DUF1353)
MFDLSPLRVDFVDRGRIALDWPLTWRDAEGAVTVPAGFISDGASIPPIAWPLVGHPYAGSLLRAALLHDYELASRTAPTSLAVHRRFYEALRASGVGRVRAALFFLAAWGWGPRW